jgi:GrpB-like predicted nucleotidyltransferase (UPF0157 family)
MKADRYPESYFEKISNDPIVLKPFDSESKRAALEYGERLDTLLSPFFLHAELFGSTALEIAGKGEWEFGIWLGNEKWYPVLVMMINHFGSIHFLSDDFALFKDLCNGTEVEIIPMRGAAAARNQALNKYWRDHPQVVEMYRSGKIAHAHSRREYYRWKNQFISDIVDKL